MKFVSVGRKGRQFLSRSDRDLMADFVIDDAVPYVQIKQMTEFMIDKFLSGKIDTVEVLYPRFINVLTQAQSFAKL